MSDYNYLYKTFVKKELELENGPNQNMLDPETITALLDDLKSVQGRELSDEEKASVVANYFWYKYFWLLDTACCIMNKGQVEHLQLCKKILTTLKFPLNSLRKYTIIVAEFEQSNDPELQVTEEDTTYTKDTISYLMDQSHDFNREVLSVLYEHHRKFDPLFIKFVFKTVVEFIGGEKHLILHRKLHKKYTEVVYYYTILDRNIL